MVAPTGVSLVWFSILGGAAFEAAGSLDIGELAAIVGSPETAPFFVFIMVLMCVSLVIAIRKERHLQHGAHTDAVHPDPETD